MKCQEAGGGPADAAETSVDTHRPVSCASATWNGCGSLVCYTLITNPIARWPCEQQ
jgi:hypothetical protein